MNIDIFNLPKPNAKRMAVRLKPAGERAVKKGHPWVFESAIDRQSHAGESGDLAVIYTKKTNKFLAIGLYDPDSPIRIKILQHHTQQTIDRDWFIEKLSGAKSIRDEIDSSSTTGYRLVHGENDGLPGVVIDRYAETLVLKLYSAMWLRHFIPLTEAMDAVYPQEQWVLRLSRQMQTQELYGLYDGQVIYGDEVDAPVTFSENGLRFSADVIQGHKTGFFFDQRDNRQQVRELAEGKYVLDVFSYNGGFSVYTAAGGARHVTSLDISQPALNDAEANMALNTDNANVAQVEHDILVADAFDGLRKLAKRNRQFDMVIVDPPSFAKSQAEVEGALSAYRRLTELALSVLTPDGILVMASCSSRVSAEDFFQTVHQTAKQAGSPLKEIQRTYHAVDHPIGFPEGAYLKCLFARV